MWISRLLLTLLLTVALFPWGAYAAVISAGTEAPVVSVEAPIASITQARLCHGSALTGSQCHVQGALLPAEIRLAVPTYRTATDEFGGLWRKGQILSPPRTPPRFS